MKGGHWTSAATVSLNGQCAQNILRCAFFSNKILMPTKVQLNVKLFRDIFTRK